LPIATAHARTPEINQLLESISASPESPSPHAISCPQKCAIGRFDIGEPGPTVLVTMHLQSAPRAIFDDSRAIIQALLY
jgi:hypothetical protein